MLGEKLFYKIDSSLSGESIVPPAPQLISIRDSRTKRLIYHSLRDPKLNFPEIPYQSNSLLFHFFPGSYAALRGLKYQYQLTGYDDEWSSPSNDPFIELTMLTEGNYTLNVRMLMDEFVVGDAYQLDFKIRPPLLRTWFAYITYVLSILISLIFIIKWFTGRIQRRARYLEILVDRRTVQLEKANEELRDAINVAESASNAKSQFLANMSHEIRTPLNGSLGMCKLMEFTKLSKEQSDLLHTMRTSNESLLAIINDILDFSKIESGNVHFEEIPYNLHTLVDETIDLVISSITGKPIELTYSVPPQIEAWRWGDPTRIRQILLNLFSNAIKFTKNGSIHLSIEPFENLPDQLLFSVKDTGIGIPEHILNSLFKPFSQGDQSTSRYYGGTGLGLSICKMLCETMGGNIWVESEKKKGSVFSFTIPAPIARTKETEKESQEEQENSTLQQEGQSYFTCIPSPFLELQIKQILEQGKGSIYSFKSLNSLLNALESHAGSDANTTLIIDVESYLKNEAGIEAVSSCLEKCEEYKMILIQPLDENGPTEWEHRNVSGIYKPIRRYQFLKKLEQPSEGPSTSNVKDAEDAQNWDAEGSPPVIEETSKKPVIFVVEDNRVNQKVASLILKKLGFDYEIANNGLEAVEKHDPNRHTLVLMDIQMPGMDGIEATQRILQQCHDTTPPTIIAMSAGVLEDERQRCIQAGMKDFISKPIKFELLEEKLAYYCAELEAKTQIEG